MPHAFQILTRSLQAVCSHIISGLCQWYVDDLMAVSPITTYVYDSTIVDNTVQQLLGIGSIAKKKSQCARALEFLGWTINLDTQTVTLCDRNLHKLIHALFCFNTEDKLSIALIQRIASLASRASMLSRHNLQILAWTVAPNITPPTTNLCWQSFASATQPLH